MEVFYVALAQYGWSAKHATTGKELSGQIDDIPVEAFKELIDIVNLPDRAICSSKRIILPSEGAFFRWFRITNKWLQQ